MTELPRMSTPPDAATKVGGQPAWLTEPTWPLSNELDVPMTFLGQVVLRESPLTLAYVFMTQDEDDAGLETWVPDLGENAVVIQPDGVAPPRVRTEHRRTGPGLVDADGAPFELVLPDEGHPAVQVGGTPSWIQDDERPGPGWHLALQVDSAQVAAFINFGDSGVGYAFVTEDLTRGAFVWQCS